MKQSTIYLKLANNRILSECSAGMTEGALWLFLPKMTMTEAAGIAFDTEALQTILFHYGVMYDVYEGYTEVKAMMQRGDDVEIQLVGGRRTEEKVKDEDDRTGDGSDELPDGSGS